MEVPRWLEVTLFAVSIAMFIGSLVAIPIIIRRLPPDHFVRPPQQHSLKAKVVRNALGGVAEEPGLQGVATYAVTGSPGMVSGCLPAFERMR